MIKVSVMYPYQAGARFDHDYYAHQHMPLLKQRMGEDWDPERTPRHIPYMVVVGEKDMAARVVSPRTREGQQQPAVGLDEFALRLAKEALPPPIGPVGASI